MMTSSQECHQHNDTSTATTMARAVMPAAAPVLRVADWLDSVAGKVINNYLVLTVAAKEKADIL